MPAAIYAISYQDTGAILSYCQLEQRDLSAKGAANLLREEILGENLVLTLAQPGGAPIQIAREHLRVDEVDIKLPTTPTPMKLEDFLRAPYRFVLDLSDDGTKPGDGTKKTAIFPPPAAQTLALYSQAVTNPPDPADKGTFVVHRPADFPSNTEMFVVIDGQEQSIKVGQPKPDVRFAFDSTQNQVYSVLFASRNLTPFFGLMKAQ